jgi:hypothetical protein
MLVSQQYYPCLVARTYWSAAPIGLIVHDMFSVALPAGMQEYKAKRKCLEHGYVGCYCWTLFQFVFRIEIPTEYSALPAVVPVTGVLAA